MPYSIEFLADLDRTLTRSTLARYLTATSGNLDEALQLYEKNMAVAGALFGILHGVEVAVRNSLHYALSNDLGGDDWFQHGRALPFPAAPQLEFTAPMRNMRGQAPPKCRTRSASRPSHFGRSCMEPFRWKSRKC